MLRDQTVVIRNLKTDKRCQISISRVWACARIREELLMGCELIGFPVAHDLQAVPNPGEAKVFNVFGAERQVAPGVFSTKPVLGQILLTVES